jgi:hypothetical protein
MIDTRTHTLTWGPFEPGEVIPFGDSTLPAQDALPILAHAAVDDGYTVFAARRDDGRISMAAIRTDPVRAAVAVPNPVRVA